VNEKVQSRTSPHIINQLSANLTLSHPAAPFHIVLSCAYIFSMSLAASRTALRHTARLPGRAGRRFESTTSKATEAAKDTATKASESAKQAASNLQSKATEGLSKVSSAAGPAIAGAAKGLGNALSKIGGRTGRLIAFVESMCHLQDIN